MSRFCGNCGTRLDDGIMFCPVCGNNTQPGTGPDPYRPAPQRKKKGSGIADIFIIVDVVNYSETYEMFGLKNHMSPDDHYQDLKRVIAAANGKAKRINVIMPFMYESRQHKRTKRESLDCALMLQELKSLGVENILTVDAHDPRVRNAIPLSSFDTLTCYYQFISAILDK